MKKRLRILILILLFLSVGVYTLYRLYMPDLVANAILAKEPSVLLPAPVVKKLEKIKAPVNYGAEQVVKRMADSQIPMEKVLQAIDEVQEEQVYAFLDEMNGLEQITDTDHVFDMAKRHFPVDFDVEPFRAPFNEEVSLKMIRKALRYANVYRETDRMDPASAKSIAKKILIEKEKEFRLSLNNPGKF